MSLCIKTGADLWIVSRNAVVHCDAYYVAHEGGAGNEPGCYVFRHAQGAWFYPSGKAREQSKAHCHFWLLDAAIDAQHRILELETAYVIVAPEGDVLDNLNWETGDHV